MDAAPLPPAQAHLSLKDTQAIQGIFPIGRAGSTVSSHEVPCEENNELCSLVWDLSVGPFGGSLTAILLVGIAWLLMDIANAVAPRYDIDKWTTQRDRSTRAMNMQRHVPATTPSSFGE
jgi:hypothetical protein